MLDFLGEIILMYIFRYPGAGIRWLVSRLWRSKKTFKEFVQDDFYTNGLIGVGTVFLLVVLIMKL